MRSVSKIKAVIYTFYVTNCKIILTILLKRCNNGIVTDGVYYK